jgi:hypothetical protein
MLAARVAKNLRLNFNQGRVPIKQSNTKNNKEGNTKNNKQGNKNDTRKNLGKVGKNNVERATSQVVQPFNSGLTTYSNLNNRTAAQPFNSGLSTYSYLNNRTAAQPFTSGLDNRTAVIRELDSISEKSGKDPTVRALVNIGRQIAS